MESTGDAPSSESAHASNNTENNTTITSKLHKQINNIIKANEELPENSKAIDFTKCVTLNELIITACELNNYDALHYLLQGKPIIHLLNNPHATEDEVDRQRTTAFCHAIYSKSNSSRMIEMLYDFWCNKIHWSGYNADDEKNNVIDTIRRVGLSLSNARKDCEIYLLKPLQAQLNTDIDCLCQYNTFQIELYMKLQELRTQKISKNIETSSSNMKTDNDIQTELNDIKNKVTAMLDVIRAVLCIYIKYSSIDKVLSTSTIELNPIITEGLTFENNIYYKSLIYINYELYFRKLDFNVSLLILDNLDFLKKHLTFTDEAYQEMECTIYHYIYRTNENWRLYLPDNKQKVTSDVHLLEMFNTFCEDHDINFDQQIYDKLQNGILLFLERKRFDECLTHFRKLFDGVQIDDNKVVVQPVSTSMHCLTLLPYMRDDYSLKKISHIIETVINDKEVFDETKVLMIEKAIKTIGEMLKSSEESFHLSQTTKALVQAELSKATIKNLHDLRDFICHINYKGQVTLNTRIDVANNDINKYELILEDLININNCLKTVQSIYKPILDKSLIEKGVSLLNERLEEIPKEYQNSSVEAQIWRFSQPNSEQLSKEVSQLIEIRKSLMKEKLEILVEIHYVVIKKIGKYFTAVKNILGNMKNNNENWNNLKPELERLDLKYKFKLTKMISEYPNEDNLKKIIRRLEAKQNKDGDIKSLVDNIKDIKDLSADFKLIKTLSLFCVKEVWEFQIFKDRINENSVYDAATIDAIIELIEHIENASGRSSPSFRVGDTIILYRGIRQYPSATTLRIAEEYSFNGITDLLNIFKANANKSDSISKRDITISCLKNRINLLRNQLEDKPLAPQVMRYKHDQKFRIVIYMLLEDIFNILRTFDIQHLIEKSTKLMAGCNLRNMLAHGNPFLDIIGEVLDDEDFATEIMSKSIMVLNDEEVRKLTS